jgi:hypothetical protein
MAEAAQAEKAARMATGQNTRGTESQLAEAWYKSDPLYHLRQSRGFGSSTQRGGTVLFALSNPAVEYKTFLEKSRAVLNDLGTCEEALEILRSLLDATDDLPVVEEIHFKTISVDPAIVSALSASYAKHFTQEEQDVLESFGKGAVYPPSDYQAVLGSEAYALNHTNGSVLKVGDEELTLTEEERSDISKGGVSVGALSMLYMTALEDCGM